MAKPKLCLIPASQGSKLFSVLPSSGVGDFDFSRSGSATRINSQGLIETVANGQSRLNYPMIDGKVVGCPHHILEPARTNLITYSEDFSNAYWVKSGASVVSDAAISPDGSLNAFKLVEGTNNGQHQIFPSSSSGTDVVRTISFFVKMDGVSKIGIRNNDGKYITYDIINNTTLDKTITNDFVSSDFNNGWKKLSISWDSTTAATGARIFLLNDAYTTGNPLTYSYTGDGTSGIYIYGAQLEQGSYPTSYIPNYGTAEGVTRQVETATGSGDAATFNDSEGVLMAEIKSENTSVGWIGLGSNSANRILLGGNGTYIRSYNNIGGTIIDYTSPIIVSDNNKIAIKYKSGDTDIYINGFKLFESNSAFSVSSPFDEIQFKNLAGETQNFYGNTKQLQYYNSALTDSELEQLTSWTSFSDMANGQLYTIE